MKFIFWYWIIYGLVLVTGILLANSLSFDSPFEKTGFILSINLLYLIPSGIILLFNWVSLKRLANYNPAQLTFAQRVFIKIWVYWLPFITFIGVIDLLAVHLPKAVMDHNSMGLNSFSMATGLAVGGGRSFYLVRKALKS